jgi:uncharacterized protein (TIGR00725 family)
MPDDLAPRRLHVAVIGPGTADAATAAAAEEIGRRLGEAGAAIVCGGLGGVMEAACRGARSAGAPTIGLLPGDDPDAANRWVETAIPTGLGELRNGLVVRAADAVVAVGGAYGTLSEIALALRAGLVVVGLGTWELAQGGRVDDRILRAASPAEAAALALRAATARRRR